jgi:hypothetical protein
MCAEAKLQGRAVEIFEALHVFFFEINGRGYTLNIGQLLWRVDFAN